MLLRFRVSNFASLRDEQEISLVALDDHPDLAVVPVPLSSDRALPVVGLYGPNASGKSNVIKAAMFARSAITGSHQSWLPEDPIPRWPFRLDDECRQRPSVFVFDFVLEGTRFEYGFSLDDVKIHEEWLYAWPRGKRQRLFERSGDTLDFGPNLTGAKATIGELVRENSLFLSAAAANNHAQLRPIAAWFGNWGSTAFADAARSTIGPRRLLSEQMIQMVKFADVGVVGSVLAGDPDDERESVPATAEIRLAVRRLASVMRRGGGQRVELVHRAVTATGGEALPWHWESAGTQSWLQKAGSAVHALESGGILFVDDLGSDLHPLLTAQLVGLFQSRATNPHGAQLIFTGHDVSLLGRHVDHRLRRDQVWLVAKSEVGATTAYPLTEYGRVRDGLDDVEGRYLQGRYGAVPFFDHALLEALAGSEHG